MKKKALAILLALALTLGVSGSAFAATHTVVKGDSLSKLAEQYLGSPDRWREIYEANRDILADPNRIYVGQQVTIPGGTETVPGGEETPAPDLAAQKVDKKTQPRIIVTTDLEVDDMNGIMLTLMNCCDFDLAGIVWTAGQFHFSGDGEGTTFGEAIRQYPYYEEGVKEYDVACAVTTAGGQVENVYQLTDCRPVDPSFLTRIIDIAYRADYEYLSRNNPNYPTPDELLAIAKTGNIEFEGDFRYDTEGSELIYNAIMDDDMRTLYIQHWGGCNTTVRALVKIYDEYHNADGSAREGWDEVLNKVVTKVRASGGEDTLWEYAGIAEKFPGLKGSDWSGTPGFINYFAANTKEESPIGGNGSEVTLPYYQGEWLTKAWKFGHGQLMSQFHLMNDGQILYGEPDHFQYGIMDNIDWSVGPKLGWNNDPILAEGKLFPKVTYDPYDWMCCQWGTAAYVQMGLRSDVTKHSDDRYSVAVFNEQAARADWAIMDADEANHAPYIQAATEVDFTVKAGGTVTLGAAASDPDGDAVVLKWWVPAASCHYPTGEKEMKSQYNFITGETTEEEVDVMGDPNNVKLSAAQGNSITVTIPADAAPGSRFVVNAEATDQGVERPMTRYVQYVITVQ